MAYAQSKSFDCADLLILQKRNDFLKTHFNSLTFVGRENGGSKVTSVVRIPILNGDGSEADLYSSDINFSSDPDPASSPSVTPPDYVPNESGLQVKSNTYHDYTTYPGPGPKTKEKEESCFSGVYAWSLDRKNILLGRNSITPSDNPCFGGSETSCCSTKQPAEVPLPENLGTHLHPNSAAEAQAQGSHNLSLSVSNSVNSLSLCGDGRPQDVNSMNSRSIQNVKRKHRTRARVKHFRNKGTKTGPATRALASYVVSVGHLLLYLPAMFVVGLQGSSLPPGVALFCGIVVYCDFLIQPVALLLVSHRLRLEVERTICSLFGNKGKDTLQPR